MWKNLLEPFPILKLRCPKLSLLCVAVSMTTNRCNNIKAKIYKSSFVNDMNHKQNLMKVHSFKGSKE